VATRSSTRSESQWDPISRQGGAPCAGEFVMDQRYR
jgi:hypothetical protein